MACSTAAPHFSILLRTRTRTRQAEIGGGSSGGGGGGRRREAHGNGKVRALASEDSAGGASYSRRRAPPGVDTRIHWENPDEGWIGGGKTRSPPPPQQQQLSSDSELKEDNFSHKFAELLKNSTDSHYQ